MSPQRVQLRRTKGWRKPPGVVVVARPSRWGNPWTVGQEVEIGYFTTMQGSGVGNYDPDRRVRGDARFRRRLTADEAVMLYHDDLLYGLSESGGDYDDLRAAFAKLRGKNLACWCPLDQPCHADVLLELANPAEVPG